MKRLPGRVLLALIAAYQRWISPGLPRRCKYEPTCSAYAAEAVSELGPLRGSVLAAWRLLRCNPFSRGGIDDLADRTLFRTARPRSERHACGPEAHPNDPPDPPRRTARVSP